jgi:hypothetical protein
VTTSRCLVLILAVACDRPTAPAADAAPTATASASSAAAAATARELRAPGVEALRELSRQKVDDHLYTWGCTVVGGGRMLGGFSRDCERDDGRRAEVYYEPLTPPEARDEMLAFATRGRVWASGSDRVLAVGVYQGEARDDAASEEMLTALVARATGPDPFAIVERTSTWLKPRTEQVDGGIVIPDALVEDAVRVLKATGHRDARFDGGQWRDPRTNPDPGNITARFVGTGEDGGKTEVEIRCAELAHVAPKPSDVEAGEAMWLFERCAVVVAVDTKQGRPDHERSRRLLQTLLSSPPLPNLSGP